MAVTSTLPPIPGDPIDPPPKKTPTKVRQLESRPGAVGVGSGVAYRAYLRFSKTQATLLAAGTTYYLFLAMFSIIAFAYGVAATLGAEQISEYLTEAIAEAFPGLLGDDGIDPETLRAVGQATGILGLVGLLYGGGGSVNAARQSIHQVFGAPKDARNIVVARLRSLLWLVAVGPLILLSFVASSFTSDLANQVFDALWITWQGPNALITFASVALAFAVDFFIVYLLVGNLGGIRPPTRARVVGAAAGAVLFGLLKALMTLLVGFTIDRPEYGALAAPIGILFVLFLLSVALYASAALTAGVADRDTPLSVLEEDSVTEARSVLADAVLAHQDQSPERPGEQDREQGRAT